MGKKVVTFGEIMLRLSPPGYQRFVQAEQFDVVYGGGEANVAVSLANYGLDSYFVTKTPKINGQNTVNTCADLVFTPTTSSGMAIAWGSISWKWVLRKDLLKLFMTGRTQLLPKLNPEILLGIRSFPMPSGFISPVLRPPWETAQRQSL